MMERDDVLALVSQLVDHRAPHCSMAVAKVLATADREMSVREIATVLDANERAVRRGIGHLKRLGYLANDDGARTIQWPNK